MGKQIKMSSRLNGVGGSTGVVTLEVGWKEFEVRNVVKNLAKDTIRNYEEKVYRKFFDWLLSKGINNIRGITSNIIFGYTVYLNKLGISHNSVTSYLRAVRTFMNYMMEKGFVDKYKIEIPKDVSKVVQCYTDEHIEVLCTRPTTESFAEYRNYVVCNILASTGMRGNSLVNILNKDVDALNNTLILRHTKNGDVQVLPIPQDLMDLILEYQAIVDGLPNETLIVTYINNPFNVRALNKEIAKYANKRNVYVQKYLHSFRYWYGMNLARQDLGAFTIMKLMGHKNIRTSQGYIERAGFDISEKIEDINPLARLSTTTKKTTIKLTGRTV